MNPQRVVHVTRYGSIRGGAETYLSALTQGLRHRGIDVSLICALDPDPANPEVVALPGLLTGDRAGLEAALRERSPDLVHVHLPEQPWILEVATQIAPTILAVQDHRLDCPTGTRYHTNFGKVCEVTPGLKCLAYNVTHHCGSLRANLTLQPYREWKAARDAVRASRVELQVFSEHMADQVASVIGRRPFVTPYPAPPRGVMPEAPAAVVHDDLLAPIVTAAPATDARTRAELDRRPVLVVIGRLNREKGFRTLLELIGMVRPAVHLVIIGDGHDRAHLEKQASHATGGHRITFTGWLDANDRDRWINRAVAVLVPSMWPEPFGIVGLEAMSAGKPVVAFRVGGIPAWLTHEETGLLVAPGDHVGFANAVSALLADRALAERLGARGRVVAAERFGLQMHLDDLLGHYRRVIDAAATTR